MKKIKIITDSFADLPQRVCVKYGIDVVPASVCVDGLEMPVNTDGCFYSMQQFYMFLKGRTKITFRFADKKDFIEVFSGWLKDGYDVLYIGGYSGAFKTAKSAAEELAEQFPESELLCLDSMSISLGEGMIALQAAELARFGVEINRIYEIISEQISRLKSLHISSGALGLKQVYKFDKNGKKQISGKDKSIVARLDEALALLSEDFDKTANHTIYICHADALNLAMGLKTRVQERLPEADIEIFCGGPLIGKQLGKGSLSVFYIGKES